MTVGKRLHHTSSSLSHYKYPHGNWDPHKRAVRLVPLISQGARKLAQIPKLLKKINLHDSQRVNKQVLCHVRES